MADRQQTCIRGRCEPPREELAGRSERVRTPRRPGNGGAHAADFSPPKNPEAYTAAEFDRICNCRSKEKAGTRWLEMRKVMVAHVGVFHEGPTIQQALTKARELQDRYKHITRSDCTSQESWIC